MTTIREIYFIPLANTETCASQTKAVKRQGEGSEEMKVNGHEMEKLRQGSCSWQWVKHAWLYSDPSHALKRGTFVTSGFLTEGVLISAFAVPHCGTARNVLHPQKVVLVRMNATKPCCEHAMTTTVDFRHILTQIVTEQCKWTRRTYKHNDDLNTLKGKFA